jgi:hypothetical protein
MHVPDNRVPVGGRLAEGIVPHREHLVAQTKGVAEVAADRLVEEVGLAALGVNVRVGAEEGHECAGLVPADEDLVIRVAEETTDIRADKRNARNAVGEEHGRLTCEVLPRTEVVADPDGAVPLRTGKVRAREDKRTLGLDAAHSDGVLGLVVEHHAVDVVQVAVLPAAGMDVVLGHGDLRAVEH